MILNWNTFNSIALNWGWNYIIVKNNAWWNNNGWAWFEQDTPIDIILDNYNCRIDITWLTDDFYLWDYSLHELNIINNSQNFIQNIQESENYNYNIYNSLNKDWIGYNSNYIRGKNIKLKIYIQGKTEVDFRNKLDILLWELSKRQNCFIKKINWEYRQIRVTPISNPRIEEHYNKTFTTVEINFLSLDPYYYKITAETWTYALSGWDNQGTILINNIWLKETYITLNITVNSWTSDSLKININDESIIEYNKTYTTWDVLELNYKLWTFKKNNTNRNYDWVMKTLKVWNNEIKIEKNGNADLTIKTSYNKTYI